MDRLHPHLSRCSAYVEFETPEDAQKALKYMDGGKTTLLHCASCSQRLKALPLQEGVQWFCLMADCRSD